MYFPLPMPAEIGLAKKPVKRHAANMAEISFIKQLYINKWGIGCQLEIQTLGAGREMS